MTLWHIDDFETLTTDLPRPFPWDIVGVLPTRDEYLRIGDAAYDRHHSYCYTVSAGPTEVWCPMQSVEGRWCPPELIATVINIIFTAAATERIFDGDNMIVPFDYTADGIDILERKDAVFWIGTPTEDVDRAQYHCLATPNTWVLPVHWSSPEGWEP